MLLQDLSTGQSEMWVSPTQPHTTCSCTTNRGSMCFSVGPAKSPEKSKEHMWSSCEQLVAEIIARLSVCMQVAESMRIRCYWSGYCYFHVLSLGTKEQEHLLERFVYPTLGRIGPPLSKCKCKCNSAGIWLHYTYLFHTIVVMNSLLVYGCF